MWREKMEEWLEPTARRGTGVSQRVLGKAVPPQVPAIVPVAREKFALRGTNSV